MTCASLHHTFNSEGSFFYFIFSIIIQTEKKVTKKLENIDKLHKASTYIYFSIKIILVL
jgi:hypothetical protein